jgi:peptide/nickel transport system permease protein
MLEVLRQDYVNVARAKGLPGRTVIFSHALRNAILPIVTMIGIRFGYMLGGAVIIEQIFAYPGLGSYVVNGVYERNYPVVLGSLIIIAMTFAIVNLVTDILYAYLDPRVQYK